MEDKTFWWIVLIICVVGLFAILLYAIYQYYMKPEPEHEPLEFDGFGNVIVPPPPPQPPQPIELRYFLLVIHDNGMINYYPKNQKIGDYLEFHITGTSYLGDLSKQTGEFIARLVPEPNNEFNPDAIKIIHESGKHIGYIPRDYTQTIREFKELPCYCFCYLVERYDELTDTYYYYGDGYVTDTPPCNI